ncbi:MAG: polynucleotide adenylyltransferase PcnB [Spirochaetaceae bacterium]|nr:polynucleotide adenylyltransferase PcnB [Spirochaetaceae bacterium]
MRYRYERQLNGSLIKKAVVWTQEEHGIEARDVDGDAVYIVQILHDAGFETYIVGGAVRDLMLGKKPKDFDIVTTATPNQIRRYIRNSRVIGKRFRLVHAYSNSKIFEVATFRSIKEGTTSNTFGTIEEDVQRRDFTMNALFYDPAKETVIDYVGGVNDIQRKILRTVIPLNVIFRDDPVRMIRAVKYAAVAGFEVPLRIKWKIKKDAPLLAEISTSRLTEELSKIIRSEDVAAIVRELFENKLWQYLQPKADEKMRADPAFREAYLRGFSDLKTLPGEPEKKGACMAALVRPYLEKAVDWKGIGDNAKDVFFTARKFIAPAALPRFELEAGLRIILAEHEIAAKKTRLHDQRPRRHAGHHQATRARPEDGDNRV